MTDTADVLSREEFEKIWNEQMNHNQKRYAVACLDHVTKKDAADAIGIHEQTVYRWPDFVDQAVDFLLLDAKNSAMSILRSGLVKAAMLKLEGLDYKDEKLAQSVADSIMDRVLGRPTSRTEVTGPEGEPFKIEYINDWRNADKTS